MNHFFLHHKSFTSVLLLLLGLFTGARAVVYAQSADVRTAALIRYVSTTGKYSNDGLSWNTPKNNLQDAINDLHEYMKHEHIEEGGRVYVSAGTYTPTESTEITGGGILNTSFKIYSGIAVYGGFDADHPENEPQQRKMKANSLFKWEFANETILSGLHGNRMTQFNWSKGKQKYETVFPGNSYHVVWFATEGFTKNDNSNKVRAYGLKYQAVLDGFTVQGGFASESSLTERSHTAYGGGVYMVANSIVRNCVLRCNESIRRGGAVYMDGGGLVEACYLHTNQCAGVGGFEGYGGAVAIDQDGLVSHSMMVNNMARIGGALALSYLSPEDYPLSSPSSFENPYNPSAVSCLIANNTASQEAGGILFNKGGAVNRLTVVRNRCNGEDVTIKGVRYGRSAGAFFNHCGAVFNSVFWGGTVKNQDVQIAAYSNAAENKAIQVGFSAFENHDLVDWSAMSRNNVFNLEHENTPSNQDYVSEYPVFNRIPVNSQNPKETVGVLANADGTVSDYNASGWDWQPQSTSALRNKSVQIDDLPEAEYRKVLAHIYDNRDIRYRQYEPHGVLGSYISTPEKIEPHKDMSSGMQTLYVDPIQLTLKVNEQGQVGFSWDYPLNNLNRALLYFQNLRAQGNADKMRILVKAGTLYTSGAFYYNKHIRSSHFKMVDGVEIYGGYAPSLSGFDESKRNPQEYVSLLSGDVTEDSYQNNSCHIVSFNNVSNAVIDGFQISYGNSESVVGFDTDESMGFKPQFQYGGGVLCCNMSRLNNNKIPKSMTGNVIRNCVISNCTALLASAVYVFAEPGTRVSLKMENCIIHNNEAVGDKEVPAAPISTLYAGEAPGGSLDLQYPDNDKDGVAQLELLHCGILKNVGHPVVTEGESATVLLKNSFVWANANRSLANSEDLTKGELLALNQGVNVNVAANSTHCLLDEGTSIPAGLASSQAILTYVYGQPGYLTFNNPTKNVGVTTSGNITVYGEYPDFTPDNMAALVNAAEKSAPAGTDFTGAERNYGGLPDIGALENTELQANGKVIYVRDLGVNGNRGGDGSSWDEAINGNCTAFVNDHGFKGVDAQLYPEGYALTGLQWAVDEAYKRSLKKTGQGTEIEYIEKTSLPYRENGASGTAPVNSILNDDINGTHQNNPLLFSAVDTLSLVQVWVAQGEYIRAEGFFMRDGVDVYGGFPKHGNPGFKERSPKENETIIETNKTGEYVWGPKRGYYDEVNSGVDKGQWTISNLVGNAGPLENIIDGNNQTAGGGTVNKWETHSFEIDLGKPYLISTIELKGLTVEFPFLTSNNNLTFQIFGKKGNSEISLYEYSLSRGIENANPLSSINTQDSYQYIIVKLSNKSNRWTGGKATYSLKELNLAIAGARYDLNAYKNAYKGCRVLTQPYPYYRGKNINTPVPSEGKSPDNMEYNNIPLNPFVRMTSWDGFTIRHGRTQIAHGRDGGAGVALRHNGRIVNCRVTDNINQTDYQGRGGGIFCNGGEIVNCIIDNNTIDELGENDALGGGLYLRLGTVYNTCISKNRALLKGQTVNDIKADGAAVFFENGIFYNNTITQNEGNHALKSGDYFREGSIYIYNSIIYDNHNGDGYDFVGGNDPQNGVSMQVHVQSCLFENESKHYIKGPNVVFLNPIYVSKNEALFDKAKGDLSLDPQSKAVNGGQNSPGGITLPGFDANYDDRIQDCSVDIGAFETNTAYKIAGTEKEGYYNYYVAQNGQGTASANSPENAACIAKLQQVLDAAGREKQRNPNRKIRVCLAGDTPDANGNSTGFAYYPTRSIHEKNMRQARNPRTYSLIIPHGVEVWGGYSVDDKFATRDVIRNKTTLRGLYESGTQSVNVYHTITFTNDVFNEKGECLRDPASQQKLSLSEVKDRAVVDGCFVVEGMADGERPITKVGGAAVVTGFAHIRNCVLENNEASQGGGALFLRPGALVSGCLFRNNKAKLGGAVYVEPVKSMTPDSMASIYTSTLVGNTATKAGGGIYYESNAYVNSCVLWQNNANSQDNVAGVYEYPVTAFSGGNIPKTGHYPFAYSSVENQHLPGVNNQSVSTQDRAGVRFEDLKKDEFYGLTEYSVLLHTGMPIMEYKDLVVTKALTEQDFNKSPRYGRDRNNELIDDNFYIDVGARSYGMRSVVVPTKDNVLTRIFVTYPENVNMDVAETLMAHYDPKNLNTYQGGSFAYPMQHLDDALRYIIKVRDKATDEALKSKKFEIFISGGTFYPTYNYNLDSQGNSRENSFHVPEGVTIIGGLNPNDPDVGGFYCQDVSGEPYSIAGTTIRLVPRKTREIQIRRKRYDLNSNDVYEPWEMKEQTILSGHNPNAHEDNDSYHVITVKQTKSAGSVGNFLPEEYTLPVVLDGLQIMEGDAWTDDPTDKDKTHFMGGGLYLNVDLGKGERKIPLMISKCRFMGNKAGLGGAIYSNCPIGLYSSSFEQNVVESKSLDGTQGVSSDPSVVEGWGSAAYIDNSRVDFVNSLFANNEAKDPSNVQSEYGAGTVMVGHGGKVVMVNCNIVNNLATRYPAVFCSKANDQASYDAKVMNNLFVNCIFWGNRATDPDPIYGHVVNFDKPHDLANSHETMWFCAYERGLGREPLLTKDFRKTKIVLPQSGLERYEIPFIPDYMMDGNRLNNCNLYLDSDNYALNGPNFTNPSLGPGYDNFMVSANWMVYRQNCLTDQGWTYLNQNITIDPVTEEHVCKFVQEDGKTEGTSGAGAYFTKWELEGTHGNNMPLGNYPYMLYKDGTVIHRVSLDPNPTHSQTFIDIGLYEYSHIELKLDESSDVDVLWVSEKEKPENGPADGSCWEQPTSDLQRAIETLLSSRNGRAKEIRLMEGHYHPVYMIGGNLGFRFDMEGLKNSVTTSSSKIKDIPQFTVSAGWSNAIADERNCEKYPTIISLTDRSGVPNSQMKYLFALHDLRQYANKGNNATPKNEVIPLVLDGLTLVNNRSDLNPGEPGGAAIYYREQPDCPDRTKNKLTLNNCIFRENGLESDVPAVYVGKGGGSSLLKNCLFHSNRGASLVADDNVNLVNNTFALNGGNVVLRAMSNVYANVFWQNNRDAKFTGKAEFETAAPGNRILQNAYSDAGQKPGTVLEGENRILGTDNEDIFDGPNFVNPLLHAATPEEIQRRDFHLRPSKSLLNKSGEQYWDFVDPTVTPDQVEAKFKLEKDLAGSARKVGKHTDLGAYEYPLPLQRIIYVDPMRAAASGNGSSWVDAYNQEDIQKAIDMAAIYSTKEDQSYVYIKARNDGGNTGKTLLIRDGVSVYASLPSNYTAMAPGTKMADGVWAYTDQDVLDFEKKVRRERPGLLAPQGYTTIISGVKTKGEYTKKTLLDGVEIRPSKVSGSAATVTPVVLNSANDNNQPTGYEVPLVLQNAVVHDFKPTEGPVVKLNNGLLYNVLVRDNEVSASTPVVEVGPKGWAVNTTIVSGQPGAKLVNDAAHVMKGIAGDASASTFNPYLRAETATVKPDYKTVNRNLRYQLAENSKDIDDSRTIDGLPARLRELIHYDSDRDVLGNPRQIGNVDNGCFETWKIGGNHVAECPAEKNNMPDYPQPGSVVYLMENANLQFHKYVDGDPESLPQDYVFEPAYLLMKPHASLFGNGAKINLDYLAVERNLTPTAADGQHWSLLALPFDFNAAHLTRCSYTKDGVLEENGVEAQAFRYNSAKRAAYDYRFAADQSPLWEPFAGVLPANHGVLLNLPAVAPDGVYRFTAFSPDESGFVYAEDGQPKTVSLTQYNERPTDGSSHFTWAENMGWNMIGCPYLVSRYVTGTLAEDGADCPMNFPHVLYELNGETGQYQPVFSWKSGSAVEMGKSYFTQTATTSQSETVTFALPVLQNVQAASTVPQIQISGAAGSDAVVLYPQKGQETLTSYRLGADGIKWMGMNADCPQIYALNSDLTPLSVMSAAPEETEIALGVSVAEADTYTIGLTDKDAYPDYEGVWLKDALTGKCMNLLVEDYVALLEPAEDCAERFSVRFGSKGEWTDRSPATRYHVFVRNGWLRIEGLEGGERISLRNAEGRLLETAKAASATYTTALERGVYLVEINRQTFKVVF